MSGFFTRKLERHLPEDPAERQQVQGRLAKLKTVSEFLAEVVNAVKDTDLADAVAKASPWAEAIGDAAVESLAPVKFVVKVFENLGRIDDPPTLGYLACSLAYQRAFAKALPQVPELPELTPVKTRQDWRRPEDIEL